MRGLLDTPRVVNGNDVEEGVTAAALPAAHKLAADAAEAVDRHLDALLAHRHLLVAGAGL